MSKALRILPITEINDIFPGADLGVLIQSALRQQDLPLQSGDILVVTQKIVSKAEGQLVSLDDIEPSQLALTIAERAGKDARHIEVILRESKRIVRMDHGVVISETHHGFICANAGVDESNIDGAHQLALLPVDPDRSARQIRTRLLQLAEQPGEFDIAVIISDTWGRPWRNGQVNMAIGIAGMDALVDYRGQCDTYGYEMRASVIAAADELASAAELVMGKVDRAPVALIRGYRFSPAPGNIRSLQRDSATDMFR
jgi:coenzyme F420-0:L-glutamate ligase/coenzyme F420-1:gamma-L-glutamate ligase